MVYDMAILGAGPGGLTAAVYGARKALSVVVITGDIGGQTNLTIGIENYLGFEYISGADLVARFYEQIERFPVELKLGVHVQGLARAGEAFAILTDKGETLEAKTIIIATGKRPRRLGVPGEDRLRGRGVSYCAHCDGPLFAGQPVTVVGGGNSALETVNEFLEYASQITVINIADDWQADAVLLQRARGHERADGIRWLSGTRVTEVLGQDAVEAVAVEPRDGGPAERIETRGVFVEIGLIPNTEFLRGFVELNRWGEVVVDCSTNTSVPGVFAAGDATSVPDKQIIIAAGEGAKAALSAFRFLLGITDPRAMRTW